MTDLRDFDPNAAARPGAGIFGLPHRPDEAGVHVLPVPFDATTSYRKGAARGPAAVAAASTQVDLFDLLTGKPYEAGICALEADPRVLAWNLEATALAAPVIERGGDLGDDRALHAGLARVNEIGALLNDAVAKATARILDAGRLPAVLGGDHAVSFGAIQAAVARHPGIGLLHFDAHADLRPAYEGFEWSHASILHNVAARLGGVAHVVQVGIRDLSEQEHDVIRSSAGRIRALFDPEWAQWKLDPSALRARVRGWLEVLPERVWITFDVDGLDPTLCPGTGTPVPGGLSWSDAMLWLEELAASGRRVVGFDLVEVSPGDGRDDGGWDAMVGARLLYRLIGFALKSRAG